MGFCVTATLRSRRKTAQRAAGDPCRRLPRENTGRVSLIGDSVAAYAAVDGKVLVF